MWPFQLTRSVGSVTPPIAKLSAFPVISTHTLRGERDIQRYDKRTARHTFQLTRSVGSVTFINNFSFITVTISTHTLREERDYELVVFGDLFRISTHTLRGERDYLYIRIQDNLQDFNSHAPWGAWRRTQKQYYWGGISTHTLRGERDTKLVVDSVNTYNFNSHAPWGAWLYILYMWSHTTTTERTFY